MYYEIMALLKQHPELKPVHDKKAAVKYMVYNKDQWVSFDDADTFKQKVEWANKIGLGGSLIWASDTGKYEDRYVLISILEYPADFFIRRRRVFCALRPAW